MPRELQRIVVVEDDVSLRAAIARAVGRWGAMVTGVSSASELRPLLARPPMPDLLILDVRLRDETAFDVLELASRMSPAPIVVAISGKASPEEAFRLAQQGVRAYLAKPFSLDELVSAIDAACREVPHLEPLVSALVGQVPMRELQREVRRVMVREALALSEGSRSGAARLLDVTRQAVQQIVREEDSAAPSSPAGRRSDRPSAPATAPRPKHTAD